MNRDQVNWTKIAESALRFVGFALFLMLIPGCWGGGPPGDSHEEEHEHAGHVIPAHKPRSFPEAVQKLRMLNDQFKSAPTAGPSDPKDLEIAREIAEWLPEIAADSDMPERVWNEVHASADRLAAEFVKMLTEPGGRATLLESTHAEIGRLEQTLRASDPCWFGEPGRRVAGR